MFEYRDKLTLTAVDAINKKGDIIGYTLKFPFDENNFNVPDDIVAISIIEGHEDRKIYGYKAFRIFVGEVTSLREICNPENKKIYGVNKKTMSLFETADSKLFAYDDGTGKYTIYARVKEGDIVVSNTEELKDALIFISRRFKNIKDSTLEIKEYGKRRELAKKTIADMNEALKSSWSKETCSPGTKEEWNETNPSLGQCAITSLIVNDIMGGKIMRCMMPSGSHYYNMVDDKVIDLTAEQFNGEVPDYSKGEERTREYLLSNEDTKKRYKKLLIEVRNKLFDKYFEEVNANKVLNKYKDYLNDLFMFSTYDIDEYSVDDNYEYTRVILEFVTTGCIIDIKRDLKLNRYEYTVTDPFIGVLDKEEVNVPSEFLGTVMCIARDHQSSFAMARALTKAADNVR